MIEIEQFTKVYDGLVAVDDLGLTIDKGDVFGFIGPNGAGKTTTIRFLATLLKPTRGKATINGFSVTSQVDDVRRSIGYMPDTFGVYDGMKVWEYLDFFAVAYGVERAARSRIIDDILMLTDLQYKATDYVNGLSRGMKQRLCLARTLVHDPPVLILDEPASGLDPRARIEFKALVNELRAMGKTILISSHILSELADCCNKVAIIERGKLLAHGAIEDIYSQVRVNQLVEMEVTASPATAHHLLDTHERVHKLEVHGTNFRFEFEGSPNDVVALHTQLMNAGVPVLWFSKVEVNLEEAFMKITEGKVA